MNLKPIVYKIDDDLNSLQTLQEKLENKILEKEVFYYAGGTERFSHYKWDFANVHYILSHSKNKFRYGLIHCNLDGLSSSSCDWPLCRDFCGSP